MYIVCVSNNFIIQATLKILMMMMMMMVKWNENKIIFYS